MTARDEKNKNNEESEQSIIYQLETKVLDAENEQNSVDETMISSTEMTENIMEIKELYVNNIVYLRATKEIKEDNILGVVDCGVLVKVLKQEEEWSQIEFNNNYYYIKSKFLQETVPEPIETVSENSERSEQVIVEQSIAEPKIISTPISIIPFNDSDVELLCKLVQHEAGNQDYYGKQLVVCVVVNRVLSPLFPNTISEVVFSPNQFTPISYSNFWDIEVAEDTKNAVKSVLYNENSVLESSQGALFFNTPNATWMDCRRILFQHGNHIFLK